MKIQWNEVTRFSQIMAIVLFLVVYILGFYVGGKYEAKSIIGDLVSSVKFVCDDNKMFSAEFYKNFVHIEANTWKTSYIPQTIYKLGVRYANDDESVVLLIKDKAVYIAQGSPDNLTYKNCVSTTEVASSTIEKV